LKIAFDLEGLSVSCMDLLSKPLLSRLGNGRALKIASGCQFRRSQARIFEADVRIGTQGHH